jgi:ribosomal protein S12 methylthiotransferase
MAKRDKNKAIVGFIALGCPKNTVDSEKMLGRIAQAGFLISADPNQADVIVINTCAFIEPAKIESLQAIKRSIKAKRHGRVKKVIVAGCLSQRSGPELITANTGVDAIVGLGQRDDIVRIIRDTLSSTEPHAYLDPSPSPVTDDSERLLIGTAHSAYLRISEGCNHSCAFCTIPAIRGRFRSKPPQMVLNEAAELAAAGVVELNVIAQDTTYYGRDLKIRNGLAILLRELEKIPGLTWIRLMYLYPAQIDQTLIDTIRQSEKIVNYVDIPIQHISNKILKDMRRPDTEEGLHNLIHTLRSAMSDITIRTTLIVGLPGESESQFNELLEFVKWARFDALGCFKFYPEPGTPAAKMPNQVPKHIKQQREQQLMLTQQKIAFEKNTARIGTHLTCLVDSLDSEGCGRARFYGQAPEIDSICIVRNCSTQPGKFVSTKVLDTQDYDLITEQI